MIRGVDVTVLRPVLEADRLGNMVEVGSVGEAVGGVLVSPSSTDGLEAARPDGTRAAYALHFPKGYSERLEGCSVVLPEPWAGTYRVVGDPRPYMDANTPGGWHMPVEVVAAHG